MPELKGFSGFRGAMRIREAVVVVLVLVASTTAAGCSVVQDETLAMVGGPAPEARMTFASGEYLALSEFRGKRVVLGFWDTRCPHSQEVIGELNEYARKMAKQPGIVFFSFNIDGSDRKESWLQDITRRNLRSVRHVYSGNGPLDETFLMFKLTAIPVVVVVGPNGVVEGVSDDAEVVEEFIH